MDGVYLRVARGRRERERGAKGEIPVVAKINAD